MINIKGKELINILDAMSKINIAPKAEKIDNDRPVVKFVARNNSIQLISVTSKIHAAYKIDKNVTMNEAYSIDLDNSDLAKKLAVVSDKEVDLTIERTQTGLSVAGNGSIILEPVEAKTIGFKVIQMPPCSCFVAGDLGKAIKCISLALGTHSDVMSKVKIDFNVEEATLKLISFNGTLMCVYNIPLEDIDDTSKSFSGLIDGKVLKSISSMIDLVKNEIMDLVIEKDNSCIGFNCGELKITIPISQEDFVNCEKLISVSFPQTATFNIKTLKAVLSAISKVDKGNLIIETKDSQGMIHATGLSKPINIIGTNGIKIRIPMDVLKSLIGTIDDENVKIQSSTNGLVKIIPEVSEDVLFITTECKQ